VTNESDQSGSESGQPDQELMLGALEHCTKWVEFRTSHQAQTFNGYLVAVGFLAAGYFATLSARLTLIALTITAAGIIASVAFAYAVGRLIKYVDVGEQALQVLEARLASALDVQEVRLVDRAKGDRSLLSRRTAAIVGSLIIVALWVTAAVIALLQS
jgi:hypothetical protein